MRIETQNHFNTKKLICIYIFRTDCMYIYCFFLQRPIQTEHVIKVLLKTIIKNKRKKNRTKGKKKQCGTQEHYLFIIWIQGYNVKITIYDLE